MMKVIQQVLSYRECRYEVWPETNRVRAWAIFPADGPDNGAERGTAHNEGVRGSFKVAVHTAQAAIDRWLAKG